MDDIESEAVRALGAIGTKIQQAQAEEADVIMRFKSSEHTAINTTSQWKNAFAQLFEKLRYIYDRYNIIMRETAARRIQRAVWLKLFLWCVCIYIYTRFCDTLVFLFIHIYTSLWYECTHIQQRFVIKCTHKL